MNAIVYDRYGDADVMHLEEVPRPEPKKGELLIRICAVEATKADCELRSFRFPVKWFKLPLRVAMGIRAPRKRVLGIYFAGEVAQLGEGVSRFAVGDRIFGCGQLRMGAYAEYASFPEKYTMARIPEGVDFPEAASSLLGGLNAMHFMDLAKISSGANVLVNGGGGSIGLAAIQIAKARGAEVTVVDKADKEVVCRQAGADRFIDYREQDFLEDDQNYDVIFNMVPGMPYKRCIQKLNKGGRYLLGNPKLSDMLRAIFRRERDGRRVRFAFAGESQQDLDTLSDLLREGAVKPIVDRSMPLDQAVQAHRLVESEQRRGSIVLTP